MTDSVCLALALALGCGPHGVILTLLNLDLNLGQIMMTSCYTLCLYLATI